MSSVPPARSMRVGAVASTTTRSFIRAGILSARVAARGALPATIAGHDPASEALICPRCGHVESGEPSCPVCGVVFAKLREPRTPTLPARRAEPDVEEPGRPRWRWVLIVATLVGAAGLAVKARKPSDAPPPEPAEAET